MRIAIDVSSIIYGTGVSVYTKNIVENLLKLDSDNDYILFGGSFRRFYELKTMLDQYFGKKGQNITSKIFPFPPLLADTIWNKLHIIPIEKVIGGVDVFHSSDWTQPPSNAFKVTTVHDLSPILFPKLTHPRIVSTHKRRLEWVLKEVDRVIVPSQSTANDLTKLGFDPNKIRVIYEGVDPSFKRTSNDEITRVKRKYRISGKYFIAVGVNDRKNTKRIIEAFEKVKADINARLIILGHSHKAVQSTKGVIFTGFYPEADKAALFSGAEALVYPSLYEGFGIPILEAYASGVPVVTSNLGSMKEIGEGAAILVDPMRVETIVEGIKTALEEKTSLGKKGFQILQKYSWEKAALETLNVYKAAANM